MLRHGPRSFTLRVGMQQEIISTSHLKPCTDDTTEEGVLLAGAYCQAPVRRPRRSPATTAVRQQPSRSRLKTRWYLLLLSQPMSSPACTRKPFLSHPARGFMHTQGRLNLHSSTDTISTSPVNTASETQPLTSHPL
jgi:hypothetical protein